jgi:hypothetical protein
VYQLVPSLTSIALISMSGIASGSLQRRVQNLPGRTSDQKTDIANVAQDWVIRHGFHSAMVLSFVSVIATCSDPPRYGLAAVTVLILAVVWWAVSHFLWGEEIGGLAQGGLGSPAVISDATLVVVDLGLMAIFCLNKEACTSVLCDLWAVFALAV